MATFNTAFGSLPGTNDALGTNNNTKSTAPKPAQPQTPQQAQQGQQGQQAQTFAQMQSAGQARPAPQSAAANSNVTGNDLRSRLLSTLDSFQGGQNQAAFAAQSASKRADLEADFRTATERLQEDLARRGLSASTFGANQTGSLMGNQARALTTMEADLMRAQAEMDAEERRAALTGLTSLTQITTDMEMKALQLQQEAALQGRSLDLQSARDQVAKELGFGELALNRDRLTQEGQIEGARLEETRALRLQNLGISGRELDLKASEIQQNARLEGRRLDLQQARDLAEIDYRTQQLLREDRSLSLQEARDKAQNEIDKDRNQISRDEIKSRETQAGLDRKQQELDRGLREKLGMDQLEIDRLRATQEGRSFLVQLAQLIGVDKLSPEQLKALGLPGGSVTTTGGGGTGVGSGGGSGGGGSNTDFSF
jgi:hypothetical protein